MRNYIIKKLSYVFASIGLLDSLYLAITKLVHSEVYCGGSGVCDKVNSSAYAEIGGIPIAILGIGAYLAILILLYLENINNFWKDNSPLFIFGITLIGVLYSAYLTYVEIAVLHAICPYCVVSAIVMVILFIFAIIRLFTGQTE